MHFARASRDVFLQLAFVCEKRGDAVFDKLAAKGGAVIQIAEKIDGLWDVRVLLPEFSA